MSKNIINYDCEVEGQEEVEKILRKRRANAKYQATSEKYKNNKNIIEKTKRFATKSGPLKEKIKEMINNITADNEILIEEIQKQFIMKMNEANEMADLRNLKNNINLYNKLNMYLEN